MTTTNNLSEQSLFTSVACACRPNTLEWCATNSCVVFASPKSVCIAEQTDEGYHRITETVERAHSGEITCLTLMRGTFGDNDTDEVRFCTGSSSGECVLWKLRNSVGLSRVVPIRRIAKNSSVELAKMAAHGCVGAPAQVLLAILQFDVIDVQFLDTNGEEIVAVAQSLKFRNAIPATFELSHICGAIVMAVGLSDGMIDIFTSEKGSHSVQKKLSLDLCGRNKSWTRSMAFKRIGDPDYSDSLSLAAASDGLIKIWHFDSGTNNRIALEPAANNDDLLKMDQQTFCIKNGLTHSIAVTLDSVLHGQSDPIYSLAWHPSSLELLSSGANQTVVRWSYSVSDSIWLPASRFGDIVGEGVSCYDITYSPCGRFALCHSFLGGFHFWEIGAKGVLPKCFPIGGHFAEVTDLCWEPNGSFLLTCSADMTTRIFAKHKQSALFFEIARPQTHGHPLHCLSSLHRNLFVSGGEEKIFRVFRATSSFAHNLEMLCDETPPVQHAIVDERFLRLSTTAAFQSELTLTNQAVVEFGDGVVEGDSSAGGGAIYAPADALFTDPPREDQLNRFTLFPEEHKLYGHGFEVFSCASSHSGDVLATSCKASHFEHAGILLWDTVSWELVNTLKAHQLTVTRLSFSHDDQFLLSVSRDRTWTLFRRPIASPPSAFAFVLFRRSEKTQSHSRIIWDCAWCADAHHFATCSRDKTLKLWTISGKNGDQEPTEEVVNTATFVGHESQTAVDVAPTRIRDSSYLVAVGFEDGVISLFDYSPSSHVLRILFQFSENSAHSSRINRLQFRPVAGKENGERNEDIVLSSASAFTVKVHKIKV